MTQKLLYNRFWVNGSGAKTKYIESKNLIMYSCLKPYLTWEYWNRSFSVTWDISTSSKFICFVNSLGSVVPFLLDNLIRHCIKIDNLFFGSLTLANILGKINDIFKIWGKTLVKPLFLHLKKWNYTKFWIF